MAGDEAMVKAGTLYGVGVGPGDPELMTVKAWRLLSTVPVIAYLAANGENSTAREIAKPFIPEDVIELAIDVPMRPEPEPAQAAYDKGCAALSEHLNAGRAVAMLCEGDPFFYGSFAYIFERLSDRFPTIVVPGVTSITASAARLGRPLVARNQVLKVIPATLNAERLREELATAESAAIIKVGRHFGKVREVLAGLGLTQKSLIIERATYGNERIVKFDDVEGNMLSYFSIVQVSS
jgi:precorrin-2/cobalt-factor-2 C20-methyltransferase